MRSRRTVLAAAAALPLLGACSPGQPELPWLEVSEAWRRPTAGETAGVCLRNDLLALAEVPTSKRLQATGLEVASGRERWRVTADGLDVAGAGRVRLTPRGPLTNTGTREVERPLIAVAADVLPLSYAGQGTTSGVVGLDLADGRPRWVVPTPQGTNGTSFVTAVSESTVLVTVAEQIPERWRNFGAEVTTIAVRAEDGAVLWQHRNTLGLGADADAVVVATRRGQDWVGQVMDAATGQVRGSVQEVLTSQYDVGTTCAGVTVFDSGQAAARRQVVVRLADGGVLDHDGEPTTTPVATDPPLLVWDNGSSWWDDGPRGFVTQELPDGAPRRGRLRPRGLELRGPVGASGSPYVWGVFITTNGGASHDDQAGLCAVDRTGAARSVSLADGFGAVSRDWLVTTTADDALRVLRLRAA